LAKEKMIDIISRTCEESWNLAHQRRLHGGSGFRDEVREEYTLKIVLSRLREKHVDLCTKTQSTNSVAETNT
jgi:hypothetical protein